MKILLACDWFLKLVVPNQARALAELGHDVRLMTRDHALEFNGDFAERRQTLDSAGVETIEIPGSRYGPLSAPDLRRIRRELRSWNPDVVSAHENADPRMVALSGRTPIVYTIHDPEAHPESHTQSRREVLSNRLWERQAAAIVIHSEHLRSQLRPSLARRKRIACVPHGVDIPPRALAVPSEPTILLFGRLEEYKGVDGLVAAMGLLWERRPDARLIIAGRGPAAASVPSDPRIEVISRYIAESELPELLKRTRVSALPYIQASQSGVGLMTISHGIPTVITNVGGLPDLAFSEALAVEPRHPRALAEALEAALAMDSADRAAIREFADARFSWRVVAERYADLYTTVI